MAATPTPDLLGQQLFQARLKANDFVQEHLKTIVTVASGTLVLTVSFVKDVIGTAGAPEHLSWLLALSWFALGASVFCGTFALATLVNNLDDADATTDNANVPKTFAAGKKGIVLRWEFASITLFGIGILALAIFGALNYRLFLQRKADKPAVPEVVTKEPPARFAMISTPERQGVKSTGYTHTFLLDESTGEVWQMVCSKGHIVSFNKTSVEGIPAPPSH